MKSNRQHKESSQRGASLVEYAFCVLLLIITAFSAVTYVGAEIRETFIAGGGTVSTMNNDDDLLEAQKD